jgi:hypothetical protein
MQHTRLKEGIEVLTKKKRRLLFEIGALVKLRDVLKSEPVVRIRCCLPSLSFVRPRPLSTWRTRPPP